MNAAHLHLFLNHVPVLGAIGLLTLFSIALVRRDSSLARLTLGLSVLLAGASIAVFLTGEPAAELVEDLSGTVERAIEPHEEAAMVATIAFGVFGAMSLAALVAFRRRTMPRWVTGAAVSGTIVLSGLMGWTANLGGQIRHPEIRTGFETPAPHDDTEREWPPERER